ncbi:PREDICTED: 24-methylenesterol C-methyltransferase 3-like [Camelina sativa]|uniref:Methyltransferase n=1 Tax=Camelina sativa TaxID=90675 RepID=A0ABM0WJ04_CAMSA|nr:PREDICTED: 24-methylenesterol C-methyltransferase 3-like [Camelina sativa]
MVNSVILFCTAGLVAGALYLFVCVLGPSDLKGKRALELTEGSVSAEKVPEFVDTFYNIVTDIFEWTWGQSLHSSPHIPGKSNKDATRIHEEMAGELINAESGQMILDAGCGLGGPMRAIAAHSRAQIIGITNNEYQVQRAKLHNKKAGLDSLCNVLYGNFLEMPFDENTFDGAYSIEATCHAPKLEEVYSEIFRVMKPGALFVSYDWVKTEKYRDDDEEHKDLIQGLERGHAIPGLRSYKDIAATAMKIGFEVVKEKDLAKPPSKPWWNRLKMGRSVYWRSRVVVVILSAIGLVPKETVDAYDLLLKNTDYLIKAGETGIFSPMRMILCKKPEKGSE